MPIRKGGRSVHDSSLAEYLDRVLTAAPPVYVLQPPPGLLVELTTGTFADPPVTSPVENPVRVVADADLLGQLFDTFRAGHQAAELTDRDLIAYRSAASTPLSGPLIVTEADVATVVSFGQTYGVFEGERPELSTLGFDRAREVWTDAEPESADRPAWRSVSVSLSNNTAPETLETFTALLDARRGATPDETIDVPTVAVLAGAATGALQKNIAAWCSDHSVAAESTVSNRKNDLVEAGIVSTRRDPQGGVGAPVHRLALADEHLESLPPAELYEVAVDVLWAA